MFCFLISFLFELILDIYWKSEHRLKCSGETCTAAERSRYERAVITISLFWGNKICLSSHWGILVLCFNFKNVSFESILLKSNPRLYLSIVVEKLILVELHKLGLCYLIK